jgi:hypothetical protein
MLLRVLPPIATLSGLSQSPPQVEGTISASTVNSVVLASVLLGTYVVSFAHHLLWLCSMLTFFLSQGPQSTAELHRAKASNMYEELVDARDYIIPGAEEDEKASLLTEMHI